MRLTAQQKTRHHSQFIILNNAIKKNEKELNICLITNLLQTHQSTRLHVSISAPSLIAPDGMVPVRTDIKSTLVLPRYTSFMQPRKPGMSPVCELSPWWIEKKRNKLVKKCEQNGDFKPKYFDKHFCTQTYT